MSNPENPNSQPDGAQPTPEVPSAPEVPPAPPAPEVPSAYATNDPAYGQDAQPTAAYPPEFAQDAQPTEAYAPAYASPPAYDQQAAYAAAPHGAGPVAPAGPSGPDTRPKTFGWISLGLSVAGLVLVLIAFIPLLWVSLVLALIGGVLLLVGLILGIVTLASKKRGGKGLGIGAIIVSVLGSGAWIFALIWSLVLIGLSVGDSGSFDGDSIAPPAAEQSEDAGVDEGTDGTDDGAAATGDEQAYVEEVRPQLLVLFQEIEPSITMDEIQMAFPDESLLSMGEGILLAGDTGRDAMVEMLTQSTGGGFTSEQAARFYDIIYTAAQNHLAG